MSHPLMVDIIGHRKQGLIHSDQELQYLVDGYVKGEIPDYQISAWLMATCFNELSAEETAHLTQFMKLSGEVFDFSHLSFVADKHSTGGVGDKTTLLIAPIVAACGVHMASIAGRGLGHTGGTVDKLESIPGFNVFIESKEFVKNVTERGFCIMGQTPNICPADKKLYALRDVTHTVDSFSLICASIMSKKLAEGISGLVLDVKFGSGAFMKTPEMAKKLALMLKKIGEQNGVSTHAYLSNMNQPLGRFAGNSLEVFECLQILKNEAHVENEVDYFQSTRSLSLDISAEIIFLAGKAKDFNDAHAMAEAVLTKGQAYEKFVEFCKHQGGNLNQLPTAPHTMVVTSDQSGFVKSVNTEELGLAGIQLKAGRVKTNDKIHLSAGFEWHFQIGQKIENGDPLFTLYAEDKTLFEEAKNRFLNSIGWASELDDKTNFKIIHEVLR